MNYRSIVTDVILFLLICPYPGTGYWDYAIKKYGSNFIDFFNESYKYYHQSKPFVNLTDMEDSVFYSHIARIKRFANIVNAWYRICTAIENPTLLLSKIREQ